MNTMPPSIPLPPTSDKDPPQSPSTASHKDPTSSSSRVADNLKEATGMPPPPRPQITTMVPSTSNLLESKRVTSSTSLHPPQTPSTSTATQDLPSASEAEADATPPPSQPSNFQPFFTLITDAHTSATHHPHKIHYLFSDDDSSELLTASLVSALQPPSPSESPGSESPSPSDSTSPSKQSSSSSSATFRKPRQETKNGRDGDGSSKGKKKKQERVIIVDVNSTGDGISGVSSLDDRWQILSAQIEKAPTQKGTFGGELEADGGGGLMLKLEGVGVDALTSSSLSISSGELRGSRERAMRGSGTREGLGIRESGVKAGGDRERRMGEEEMRELVEGLERRMGILKTVLEGTGSSGIGKASEREREKEREGSADVEEGG